MTTRTFWLTFRIEETDDWRDRYRRLQTAIIEVATSALWAEPTSFVLFKTEADPATLLAKLTAAIDHEVDLVFLSVMGSSTAFAIGKTLDSTLLALWPGVRRL